MKMRIIVPALAVVLVGIAVWLALELREKHRSLAAIEQDICRSGDQVATSALSEAQGARNDAKHYADWLRSFSDVQLPKAVLQERLRALPSFPGDGLAYATAAKCGAAIYLVRAYLNAMAPLANRSEKSRALLRRIRRDASDMYQPCRDLQKLSTDFAGADKPVQALDSWVPKVTDDIIALAGACGCPNATSLRLLAPAPEPPSSAGSQERGRTKVTQETTMVQR